MKAYVYASPGGAERRLLSQCFADFAELFRHGILNDESTVWVNAEAPEPGFWALTDRSHYIHLHRSPTPGYARVTKSRIRWDRSYNSTTSANPTVDIDAEALAGHPEAALTLVVKHRYAADGVKVINDKLVEFSEGHYSWRNLSVIDLGAHQIGTPLGSAPEFEENDARYHGANHLLRNLNPANAELIRKHLDQFAFTISADQLHTINEHLDIVDRYAESFSESLYSRLAAVHQ